MAEMLITAGVQKSHTTPYHPMGNGAVERLNHTLGSMIRALPPKTKHRWPQHLKSLTFAYNATVHENHRLCSISADILADAQAASLPVVWVCPSG